LVERLAAVFGLVGFAAGLAFGFVVFAAFFGAYFID
jgi:hypothetical protein